MIKYIYIVLGSISLSLGILGLVTPGLPTTPFVLLTGVLYSKGSPRLYEKLKKHKFLGRYLNRMNEGVSLKFKIFSILFMWTMICITVFVVFSTKPKMQYVMIGLGVAGTISQLIFLRKRKTKPVILASSELEADKSDL